MAQGFAKSLLFVEGRNDGRDFQVLPITISKPEYAGKTTAKQIGEELGTIKSVGQFRQFRKSGSPMPFFPALKTARHLRLHPSVERVRPCAQQSGIWRDRGAR